MFVLLINKTINIILFINLCFIYILILICCTVQSRLSYVTLQGTLIKRSHMTGGLLIQSPYNDQEGKVYDFSTFYRIGKKIELNN